jgi:isopentenyl-diphosphate delta-isomerase
MPDIDETGPDGAPLARDPQAKAHHIDACLTTAVEYTKTAGFERFSFMNQALPEVSLTDIDLTTSLCGKPLRAPLMIAPMTGGVERAHELNRRLARAAEEHGLAMGVGSQRVGVEDPARARFFKVRDIAPHILLFANFGAVQLAKGWGIDHARQAVSMIEADALFLHFNPIQEAAQGGDVDFANLAAKVRALCSALAGDGVPVFAREVGFGMSAQAARMLVDAGVAGIDCAGAGGTSWAKVEGVCAKSERRKKMGHRFGEWGIPTTTAIREVRAASQRIPLIATGGLRSGVDVALALALGADIGAMARPMLVAAHAGEEELRSFIEDVVTELRISMFGIGARNLEDLKRTPHLRELDHPVIRS